MRGEKGPSASSTWEGSHAALSLSLPPLCSLPLPASRPVTLHPAVMGCYPSHPPHSHHRHPRAPSSLLPRAPRTLSPRPLPSGQLRADALSLNAVPDPDSGASCALPTPGYASEPSSPDLPAPRARSPPRRTQLPSHSQARSSHDDGADDYDDRGARWPRRRSLRRAGRLPVRCRRSARSLSTAGR